MSYVLGVVYTKMNVLKATKAQTSAIHAHVSARYAEKRQSFIADLTDT